MTLYLSADNPYIAPPIMPVIVPNYCAKKEKLFVCDAVKYSLVHNL